MVLHGTTTDGSAADALGDASDPVHRSDLGGDVRTAVKEQALGKLADRTNLDTGDYRRVAVALGEGQSSRRAGSAPSRGSREACGPSQAHGRRQATALTHALRCRIPSRPLAHRRPRGPAGAPYLPAQGDERPDRVEQRGHRSHRPATLGTPRRICAEGVQNQRSPPDPASAGARDGVFRGLGHDVMAER